MGLPRKKRKAESEFYIDNDQLVKEVLEYKVLALAAKEQGLPRPKMPDSLGLKIFMIADRLSTYRSFAHYTYKDDMVATAVENCIRYISNFNPEKSNNAFAYFTRIVYCAFIGIINAEKKQRETKRKYAESMGFNTEPTVLKDPDEIVEGELEVAVVAEEDTSDEPMSGDKDYSV